MPSLELHALAWPNTDARIVSGHTSVMDKFRQKCIYTFQEARHGLWMDAIMSESRADVVGFIDIDCIPLNESAIPRAAKWAYDNKSFVGIAQVSNHIPPASHIYAAPAFFFIYRQAWEELGKPTFAETPHGDVAENVCYAAELLKRPYRTLYPLSYTKPPSEGAWRLHTYGHYGIGTVFETGVYHLYQSRMGNNADFFCNACKAVIDEEGGDPPVGAYFNARAGWPA